MHNALRCLTTVEVIWHFSMLLLILVASSGRFTLARGRTATSSNPLVVCTGSIGEGAQDGGIARLLLLMVLMELGS